MSDEGGEESECCYGNWSCNFCGNSGSYHFGSQRPVVCRWVWKDDRGCGRIVHDWKPPASVCNARNAVLSFLWCVRFGDNPLLQRLHKDVARVIGRYVWASRENSSLWNLSYGENGIYNYPKTHFRRASGQFRPCGKCKAPVYVWRQKSRWPFGRIKCGGCGAIVRTVRGEDSRRYVVDEGELSDEEEERFNDEIPSDAE